MLDALDADAVRAWAAASVALLDEHRSEIDALNVFPVADADTGSNMLATARAGANDVAAERSPSPSALLASWAAGAARGAAGNSGFILSQVLRGLAAAAEDWAVFDAAAFAAGLAEGARLGRDAVVSPVEGTVLTVARAAAEAARASTQSPVCTLATAARAALEAAGAALEHTTAQLDALRDAGVVDAGGQGLVVVLAALVRVVEGEAGGSTLTAPVALLGRAHGSSANAAHGFAFEVQYLLDTDTDTDTDTDIEAGRGAGTDVRRALGEQLSMLGDSVVVVPAAARTWNVHVHVHDVGAAIEAGLAFGRPHGIRVSDLRPPPPPDPATPGDTAVVTVAPGAGLAHLFEREGVRVVERAPLPEGQGGDQAASGIGAPDDVAAAVLGALREAKAGQVVLLPNGMGPREAAEAAAEHARGEGMRVAVVPTRSPVQALAAIAVHDGRRAFDDNVVAMAEAAAATRFAQVVVAETEGLTAVGVCSPGDVLGLIDGEVVDIGGTVLAVVFGVLDRLLAVGGELMTVLVGTQAPNRTGALIEQHVRERTQLIDVVTYAAGQADIPVIIGVE